VISPDTLSNLAKWNSMNDELAKLEIAMTLEFVRLSVATVPLVSVAILMNSSYRLA
jgi:hypothetical protein